MIPYCPEVFIPHDLDHAKAIILSNDPTQEKWVHETRHTVDLIIASFEEAGQPIGPESVLLDYGCGIGRIARLLIQETGCVVIGADISPGMLELGLRYVDSPNFILCPQAALPPLTAALEVTGAYSIWTLQHCFQPHEDVHLISRSLQERGLFFALNKFNRYLPVRAGNGKAEFVDDEVDVHGLILEDFDQIGDYPFPSEVPDTLCGLFQKR